MQHTSSCRNLLLIDIILARSCNALIELTRAVTQVRRSILRSLGRAKLLRAREIRIHIGSRLYALKSKRE